MKREHGATHVASIQLFCKAAELDSFSDAAEALGITPAAVSRSIARLEQRLGAQLFVRSTRRVRLTDAGRSYFEQCMQAIHQLHEAERAVQGHQSQPNGTLRISMPTTYGHFRVIPLLPEFRRLYPQITLDIDVSNHNIDLIHDGFDLAIRLGAPRDSRLVARKLEDASLGLYAARSYLKRRGTPKSLSDLDHYDCIQFEHPGSHRLIPWLLKERGKEIEAIFTSPVRFTGDVLACVNLATAGGGIVQIYDFVVSGMKLKNELMEVLPALRGRTRPFGILYPKQQFQKASAKAFVDFLLNAAKNFTLKI